MPPRELTLQQEKDVINTCEAECCCTFGIAKIASRFPGCISNCAPLGHGVRT